MVRRYRFGSPMDTEAVVNRPELSTGEPVYFEKCGNVLRHALSEQDLVYGLGENVRGINKRGWIYTSNCTDNPHHHEDTRALYSSHNFLIVDGAGHLPFGLFLDTPATVNFDVGYTVNSMLEIRIESDDYEVYEIEGETPAEIVTLFRQMIGRPFLPPKWAFGYGQSRWGYRTAADVREVAEKFRENGIPLDSIYLDIDYMERYKDFTIDRERFPDFEQLVAEMKEQKIHLVPIIDGGVKVEEGYDTYEEGVRNNYFCKDENGEDFVIGVWPGRCHFPDMLNDEARSWFGHKYQFLLDKGIDGFWNDMNEPAIFYSERRLNQMFGKMEEYRTKNLDLGTFFGLMGMVNGLANNEEDYRSFYHNYKGRRVRHDQVHNLFGYYMTRSAGEAFEELAPDRRILMFSRSSYVGMHRYGGTWMGDNKSWWSHLLMNLKMLPSLNMCGFLYTGADLGGFGCDATEDLVLRWLAFGIFTPLMRNHAAHGTRRQEPYAFERTKDFADIIGLRYRLLPYLYSEFMKAALKNEMYARPLGFIWREDEIARHTEDQIMIGESIMVAPVYEQNAIGRMVYLPEEMKLVRFAGTEVTEETILPAGHHFVKVALNEVVLFVRKGHILPLSSGGRNVESVDWEHLTMIHFADAGDSYELYDDDGISRNVTLEGHCRRIEIK